MKPAIKSNALSLLLLILFSTLSLHTKAQQPEEKKAAETVAEKVAEKAPAPAIALQLSKIFGKDFSLETAEEGELSFKISEETGALQYFLAEPEISIRSDKFDLDCTKLEFKGKEQRLIATGQPVVVKKGDLRGKCNHLEYLIESRRIEMTEKPSLFSIDEEGQEAIISGKEIIIEEDEKGNIYIMVKLSTSITYRSKEAKQTKKPESSSPKKAQKIDEKTLDKILEPKISE